MNWEEILEQLTDFGAKGMEQTGLPVFLIAMAMSLVSALFVAYLYGVFYKSRASGSQVHRAFPLLGVSITAIFITIQFSLPLSLGLLGALSIVRFRTPIKEPEEIAFIMLVVATALCCATFNLMFLAIILIAAVAALLVMRRFVGRGGSVGHGLVILRVPGSREAPVQAKLIELLGRELPLGGLDSVTDDETGLTISYRFTGLASESVGPLRQAVSEASRDANCDIYFDRPGAP